MAKAVLTLEDTEDEGVAIHVEFGYNEDEDTAAATPAFYYAFTIHHLMKTGVIANYAPEIIEFLKEANQKENIND